MINRLIDVALKNRFIVVVLYLGLAGWGWWALHVHADRRDSRSLRQPGDRFHRLDRAQPAGGRGPGHLSADHEPARARRRAGGAVAIGVRLLDDQRDLRRQGRSVLGADTRARTLEPRHEADCRQGVTPTLGPDATGVGQVFWYTLESDRRITPRSAHAAGLVRPLSAQFRAGRRGSGLRRRLRPAVPGRRRSKPAAELQLAAQRGGVEPSVRAIQRRRQCRGVERRLAHRPRCRVDRSPSTISRTSSLVRSNGIPIYVETSPTCRSAMPFGSPRS